MLSLSGLVGMLPGVETSHYGSLQEQTASGQRVSIVRGANVMASKMVSSTKSRGREETVRSGELITKSITTQSKAVCVKE